MGMRAHLIRWHERAHRCRSLLLMGRAALRRSHRRHFSRWCAAHFSRSLDLLCAERACRARVEPFSVTLKFRSAVKDCTDDLLGKAVLETQMPDLIALHEGERKDG